MSTPDSTLTYSLDPMHSSARFSVKHMMIATVRGDFSGLSGTLTLHPLDITSAHVEASIIVDSIHTGQPDRDTHLKSAEFFDVASYPTMTFISTEVAKAGDTDAKVTGDLTIHGVTKSVTLTVEGGLQEVSDGWGNLRVGFSGETKIKRSDFGLTWNSLTEAGGIIIGDDINITLDVQFVRKP